MHKLALSVVIATALVRPAPVAASDTEEAKAVGLFFRTTSPTYLWGQNGILTAPSATTVGEWRVSLATTGDYAGDVQDEAMLDVKGSLTVSTGGDLEVGITKKTLLWAQSFERTPLDSTVLHAKYTAVDIKNEKWWWIPKVGVGVFGYQVNRKDNFDLGDTFLDGFLVVSEVMAFKPLTARLHLGANVGMLGSAETKAYFFAGGDLTTLWGWLTIACEHVGANRDGLNGVTNAGLAVNLFGIGQLGLMLYNFLDYDNSQWQVNLGANIPVGAYIEKLFN
jgi:hypothetical protein